eukprot:IDg5055t1
MSDEEASVKGLTKVEAWQKFSRIQYCCKNVISSSDSFTRYLSIARSILMQYPVQKSTGTSEAPMLDESEVCEAMVNLIGPPTSIFTDSFLCAPTYPIRILIDISRLYSFDHIDPAFLVKLNLSEFEQSHKVIINMIWLAYIVEQEPHDTCAMIDCLKQLRISQTRARAKVIPALVARTAPSV